MILLVFNNIHTCTINSNINLFLCNRDYRVNIKITIINYYLKITIPIFKNTNINVRIFWSFYIFTYNNIIIVTYMDATMDIHMVQERSFFFDSAYKVVHQKGARLGTDFGGPKTNIRVSLFLSGLAGLSLSLRSSPTNLVYIYKGSPFRN